MLYQGNIRDYLSKQPLLFDGAMGTYLADKYIQFGGESCEKWNLRYPERIKQIHKEYIDAGAVAIKTNTFAANAGDHFTAEEVRKVIAAGTQIAREAIEESAGEQILFGDIGPVVIGDENDAAERYRLPVDCFLEQGVRHFLFETLDNIEGLDEITEYIKQKQPEAFIIVSFAVSPEGLTRSGCYGRSLYQKMYRRSMHLALIVFPVLSICWISCINCQENRIQNISRSCQMPVILPYWIIERITRHIIIIMQKRCTRSQSRGRLS